MSFKNKVVLITGGSGGIGKAIAKEFLNEEATVILTDNKKSLISEAEVELAIYKERLNTKILDITSVESIRDCIQYIKEQHNQLDVLINNAGMCKIRPALEILPEEWDLVFNINLKGLFFCSQFAAKIMLENGQGTIINIASNAGKVGFPDQADYNAAKAGVISLTRSLADEWAKYNVNVNAVCPGAVETKMLVDIANLIAARDCYDPEQLLKSFAPKQLGRLISPSEVAKVVVFLASNKASIIRGQSINVDGGNTPY